MDSIEDAMKCDLQSKRKSSVEAALFWALMIRAGPLNSYSNMFKDVTKKAENMCE